MAVVLLGVGALRAKDVVIHLPVMQAGRNLYTNVTVTEATPSTVFIRHAGGISTVKVSDLDSATLVRLGYSTASSELGEPTASKKDIAPDPKSIVMSGADIATETRRGRMGPLGWLVGLAVLGGLAYLFFVKRKALQKPKPIPGKVQVKVPTSLEVER